LISQSKISAEQLVQGYLDSVTSGERATCFHERAGVARHLDDLKHAAKRGYVFDKEIATAAVDFFPTYCRHSIGEWAGEPFELHPWQAYCVWQIMGWRSLGSNVRRYRKAYLTVARKNGKTTWAAGMALLLMYADNIGDTAPFVERGARGYCAATKKPQAALLWEEAKRMIEQSPELSELATIRDYKTLIRLEQAPWFDSQFTTVGADGSTQDGLNTSFVIKDEIHAWSRCKSHRDLHEKLSTGGASRLSPLELIITTAGDDSSEIWGEEHAMAERVCEGGIDDTYFAFIAQAEEDDDVFDLTTWEKANPNWGVSVKPQYIKNQMHEALQNGSSLNQVIRYHCNRRTQGYSPAYPQATWALGSAPFEAPADNAICFGGMDLGRSDDWSAVTLVFPEEVKGAWRYTILSRTWAAAGRGKSRIPYDRDPWRTWIADGAIQFQNNEILDYTDLKAYVVEARKKYRLKSLAYDGTFAGEVAASLLNDYGVPMFEFFQTYAKYTEPIISFRKSLEDGRVSHGGDPVLQWQANNCELRENPRADGTLMIAKGWGHRWKKVDAVVAMLMGYSEAIYAAGKRKKGSAFLMPRGA